MKNLLQYNATYYQFLSQKMHNKKFMLESVLQMDLEYLEQLKVKPVALKEIISQTNETIFESGKGCRVTLDLEKADELLAYWNQKRLRTVGEEHRYLFSISEECSGEEILRKSIETRADSQTEMEEFEYISEES